MNIPDNAIVYLDPPYKNTHNVYNKSKFDTEAFLDWAFTLSKRCKVYISEYELNDKRFTPIFEIKKRVTMCKDNNTLQRTERLYTTNENG